jgi:N-acetylneuraminate synthase
LEIDNGPIVIAEVGLSHEGSLGLAQAYIDAIADAGADAVKFQTHIADAESSELEPWRIQFSKQDEKRIDYWRRTSFTEGQWRLLREHTENRGLHFLSSPFSNEAVDLLERVGVDAWKIASGEITNNFLLDRICRSQLPVLISTGMSRMKEIDEVVLRLQEHDITYAVLQCTSMYPTPPEKLGLNMLQVYRERYGCPVGLSDHSGTIYPGIAAAALGASVIEVHVVFSRKMFGPDVGSSIELEELAELVRGIKAIYRSIENPVDKDAVADELSPMRGLFTKSLVCSVKISAGQALTREMVTAKKPGTGIPVEQAEQYYGKVVVRDLPVGHYLQPEDLKTESE